MHSVVESNIAIGTSITEVFKAVNMSTGLWMMKMDVGAIPVGSTPSTTFTAAFSGSSGLVQFNLARWLAVGTLAASAHTSFGTTAGSNWVYARMFGLVEITAPGDLVISCTRTGGTSHTVQPGSFLELILA